MGNMIDYLASWGNKSFTEARFNEVDNVIFSTLVYADYRDCIPRLGAQAAPIRTVRDRYLAKIGGSGALTGRGCKKYAPALLDLMADSRRFAKLKLRDFVDLIDPDESMQVAAMTAELGDGSVYVAFRGTDNTLVGWREDFNFSFMDRTGGQVTAAQYLNRVLKNTTGPVYVGGHSTGGNFAMYAAAFCNPAVSRKIVRIYSNDGPGVNESIAVKPAYQAMLGKSIKLIPEQSIVGLLLSGQGPFKIIRSVESGLRQHDPTTWIVEGDHFARAMSRSQSSVTFDRTISTWLAGLSPLDRKKFIDSLFSVLEFSGAETVSDLKGNKLAAAAGMLKAMSGLSFEDQKVLWDIILHLADNGKGTVFRDLAIPQVKAAMQFTQAVSGAAQSGAKFVQDLVSDPVGTAAGLIAGLAPKKPEPPDIPPLADSRGDKDDIRQLMDKYDSQM